MKLYKKIIFIVILIIIYLYVCNITMFPESFILIQGENIEINTILGLNIINKSTMQASSSLNEKLTEQVRKERLRAKLV